MELHFENKEEYIRFLEQRLNLVSLDCNYNIFCHCVTNQTRYFLNPVRDNEKELQMKINSILKIGLDVDGMNSSGRYGSINGTMRFIGNSTDACSRLIADYDYFGRNNTVHTMVLAIPKYMIIEDEEIEFSSFNGCMKHRTPHDKDCVLDVVKQSRLPVEFILGYQKVDKNTGEVVFVENERHFSNLSNFEREKIMNKFIDRYIKAVEFCNKKYGVETMEEFFDKMTEEHMITINDDLCQP